MLLTNYTIFFLLKKEMLQKIKKLLIKGVNNFLWCRLSESNQSPTDYKSVALPDELKRLIKWW